MHDALVLQHTALFHMARQGEILSKPSGQINNVTIKPVLLGDGATLFQHGWWSRMRTRQIWPVLKKKFNKKLSSAIGSSERAFGLLKVRWRCPLKRLDNQIENISEVIISCFALHNFCQIENEEFIDQDGILYDLIRQERVARNRRNAPRGNQNQPYGEVVRNAIKNYLMENVWKQTNVSLTFTMLTRFVCKKLKSLFLSCRLFVADPANLS